MDYDFLNMNDQEFEAYWLELIKKEANVNPYEAEILGSTMRIIDNQDYRTLYYIMRNYDGLVKAIGDRIVDVDKVEREFPYWCYGFGSNGEEV